jgi:flagellum-specific peptidoglycan hydrolase FlgJ
MTLAGNPNAFADALTGVYATDPEYGNLLKSLMQSHNLYQYNQLSGSSGEIGETGGQPAN